MTARQHDSSVYEEVQASEKFQELKRRLRAWTFPMTIAFFLWYALYVMLSAYARDFMGTKVVGNINVALVFGLLQFVVDVPDRLAVRPVRRAASSTRWPTRSGPSSKATASERPSLAAEADAPPARSPSPCSWSSSRSPWASPSGPAGRPSTPPTSTPAAGRSPASRTAWPSAATTCRPRRSSASPASSRCHGYDGFLYSIGFLVAWLVALLLVAELMRNSGRYTMADVLAFRMRQRPVRTAAGDLHDHRVDLLPAGADGRRRRAGRAAARHQAGRRSSAWTPTPRRSPRSSCVGVLMIVYVTVGGMKGTTYVQIVKAFLLMIGAPLMTVLVLGALQVQPVRAARRRRRASPARATAFLEPGPALRHGGRRRRDADLLQQDRPALARPRPGARHRRPAAHPDPLLHRAQRQGRPQERALGASASSASSTCSPSRSASARRRWSAARRSPPRTRRATRPRRSSPRRSATSIFGGDRRRDRCSPSSRRSRSPPSSPSSPASPWRRRRPARTTCTPT